MNSAALGFHRGMGMTAEDPVEAAVLCIVQRALADLRRETQPVRVQLVEQTAEGLPLQIQLLQLKVEESAELA